MKKIAFVFAFAAAVSSQYTSADNLCRQQNENIDSWKFIEYKLITSPQSMSKKGHLLRFIPAALVGPYAALEAFGILSSTSPRLMSRSTGLKITALAGALSASTVYKFIDIIAQQIVNWHAIHSFVMQWPEYKKYTPAQLQPIFDDVYEMYLFDPSSKKYKSNAADALIIAREYIESHFPETYGKKGKYNCTKYIARQILNSAPVKMILNTLKLFL